jgi:hypothetical protein
VILGQRAYMLKGPMSLALYIVITLIYINKIHHDCRPSQTKEYGGLGLHERERGLRA